MKPLSDVFFSSQSDDWETPLWLFAELDREFQFTLDPAATPENAKCRQFFTREDDGLARDWRGVVFLNPPYGRDVGKWVRKAYYEAKRGATVVCLLPARTDTVWWHRFCLKGEIRYIKGRLKFGGAVNSAPFPSVIVIFRGS
jgi:phage N-6-adenine-methyltransferase